MNLSRTILLAFTTSALFLPATLRAQDYAPTATPPPTATSKLGRFQLGPFYVTPRIQIDSIGLDTNVFYTPTHRQTDVRAGGGPAIDLVAPFSGSFRFVAGGALDYIYFVRTVSDRRLTGSAVGGFEWEGARTSASLKANYLDTYYRPPMEIDERIDQTSRMATAQLHRLLFGRTSVAFTGSAGREETNEGQDFLGTNLHDTLSRDLYTGTAALEYLVTVKTRLVFEGSQEVSRFLVDHSRDGSRPRVDAGLRTDSSALISGEAVVGVRWFVPAVAETAPREQVTYANVDATWHVSPRTHVGGGYSTDLSYSAFTVTQGSPTLHTSIISAHAEKELLHNLDLRLLGRRLKYRTSQPVQLTLEPGAEVAAVRQDISYEASADLGYRFWQRLRIGAVVLYAERESTFADFGVDGLLVGASIVFTP